VKQNLTWALLGFYALGAASMLLPGFVLHVLAGGAAGLAAHVLSNRWGDVT
jgi:hypothetical protein